MKGMTIDEYAIITAFIQKHHKFGYVSKEDRIQRKGEDHFLFIKYIDTCYDSRDQSIWCVTIRTGSDGFRFSVNHFALTGTPKYFTFASLFEWMMAYLDGTWNNNAILRDCVVNRDTPHKEEINISVDNEKITCAAIWFDDGKVYPHSPINIDSGLVLCGHRHCNIFPQIGGLVKERTELGIFEKEQGFLTDSNRFVNREEAWYIAKLAGQIKHPNAATAGSLDSSHLY